MNKPRDKLSWDEQGRNPAKGRTRPKPSKRTNKAETQQKDEQGRNPAKGRTRPKPSKRTNKAETQQTIWLPSYFKSE